MNLFDNAGYGLAGSGVYVSNAGRFVQGYLTVDLRRTVDSLAAAL